MLNAMRASGCVALLLGLVVVGCDDVPPPGGSYFDERIQPAFDVGCAIQTNGCHVDNGGSATGNLDLSSYDSLMRREDTLPPYGPYSVGLLLLKGGDDIEERAADGDTIIARLPLRIEGTRIVGNFEAFAARIAGEERLAAGLATVLGNLAAAFLGCDATLIEINPLAVTDRGRLCALDAKVTIDDNALFRRADLADLKTHNVDVAADASEREAQSFQINYMKLEGEIGCVVNGAGLALATHDLVVDAGGRPANFMDIRTTASSLDIAKGLGLLLQNRSVRSLLVNVHGGGMQRCDTIAEGIGIAMRRAGRSLPIVIRMAGNNARFAETVLRNNGVVYTSVDDMAEAARIAVEAARQEAA